MSKFLRLHEALEQTFVFNTFRQTCSFFRLKGNGSPLDGSAEDEKMTIFDEKC
jgi:hypothetical protein